MEHETRGDTPQGRWRAARAGIICIASALLALPLLLYAEVVVRSGNEVALSDSQRVEGNFYALGRTLSTSAAIIGDAYVAAGSVVVNGPISKDLAVLGGTVQVHAPTTDDVRVMGGQVVIADRVGGDVAVFGGELTILSTAEIVGDVLFYGGSIDMAGSVGGSVIATAERIRIDGPVKGDVLAKTHSVMTLGSRAVVEGSVQYESPFELARALDATVVGEVRRADMSEEESGGMSLIPLLAMVFTALSLRFVGGRRVDDQVRYTMRSFGSYGLVGFGAFILAPLVAALLFVTAIGAIAGMLVLSLFLLLVALALALAPILVGAQIALLVKRGNPFGVLWITGGALLLFVVMQIPFVGWLAVAAVMLISFGGLLVRLYRSMR